MVKEPSYNLFGDHYLSSQMRSTNSAVIQDLLQGRKEEHHNTNEFKPLLSRESQAKASLTIVLQLCLYTFTEQELLHKAALSETSVYNLPVWRLGGRPIQMHLKGSSMMHVIRNPAFLGYLATQRPQPYRGI